MLDDHISVLIEGPALEGQHSELLVLFLLVHQYKFCMDAVPWINGCTVVRFVVAVVKGRDTVWTDALGIDVYKRQPPTWPVSA